MAVWKERLEGDFMDTRESVEFNKFEKDPEKRCDLCAFIGSVRLPDEADLCVMNAFETTPISGCKRFRLEKRGEHGAPRTS